MKKTIILIAATLLFIACKKEEIPFYTDKSGIAFYFGSSQADSLNYTFALNTTAKIKDTILLKMRVVGKVADKDRIVTISEGSGTTARKGIDYELPMVKVPAGKTTVDYPLIVYKTPDMSTKTFIIILNINANNDFILGAVGREPITQTLNSVSVKVAVSNRLDKPVYWDTEAFYNFGSYSQVKFKFMIQTTGLTDFSNSAIGIDGQYNLPVQLQNALANYVATNGPLVDENGITVSF